MAFLKADLVHLFDDKGIDKSQYDDVVQFRCMPVPRQRTVAALPRTTHRQLSSVTERGLYRGAASRDPITAYNSARGYMFNIAMLKRVFSPKFYLHDIRQTVLHLSALLLFLHSRTAAMVSLALKYALY
jgi:hypothetical protein